MSPTLTVRLLPPHQPTNPARRREKVRQPAEPAHVAAVLAYLQEVGLDAAATAKVYKQAISTIYSQANGGTAAQRLCRSWPYPSPQTPRAAPAPAMAADRLIHPATRLPARLYFELPPSYCIHFSLPP